MNGSDVSHKHLNALLWLGFRFIPHKPVLLVTCNHVDHNAICLTDGSLHKNTVMKLQASIMKEGQADDNTGLGHVE